MRTLPGIANSTARETNWGSALAAGNFGKTAPADLAIGVPGETVGGGAAAGAVHVLYGTSSGFSSS